MGENKKLRKKLASNEARVREHRAKISEERRKSHPDYGLIRHWEREISNWLSIIDTIERKLRRR